jgi:hypothetical protein
MRAWIIAFVLVAACEKDKPRPPASPPPPATPAPVPRAPGPVTCDTILTPELRAKYFPGASVTSSNPSSLPDSVTCTVVEAGKRDSEISATCDSSIDEAEKIRAIARDGLKSGEGWKDFPVGRGSVASEYTLSGVDYIVASVFDDNSPCNFTILLHPGGPDRTALAKDLIELR